MPVKFVVNLILAVVIGAILGFVLSAIPNTILRIRSNRKLKNTLAQ